MKILSYKSSSLLILMLGLYTFSFGQTGTVKAAETTGFDINEARAQAKMKGIKPAEAEGYVQFLKNEFSSKKALEKQTHKHTPYEQAVKSVDETVIYIQPNQPQSIGCPNMGFEQYSFTGWTGSTGTVSAATGTNNTIYNVTGTSIVNTAGSNVSVLNTTNYQTIMNIPATNNTAPNYTGYDSLAVRAVGTATVSDIPFVSPYSFDPVSVRLNSANANYRAARLKYVTTVSSINQRVSFSYAIVLNDPANHHVYDSPYFLVTVKNETTGQTLPGCTSYSFNPKTALPSDSLKTSVNQMNSDVTKYRKWQYYSVDLSSLPAGTSVSINFEVGGCAQGGHAGYAYVDAECGGIGVPYVSMCSGSAYATLVAPTGFTSYQWFDPSNTIIPGATNDTLIVNGPTIGNVYSVHMTSPGGCVLTATVSINPTTVNIVNLNSTSSCAGGNSGTAFVQANGSSLGYTYQWTNTSSGAVASNSQTATGLAPGSYSVLVTSPGCGQASANLSVGVAPALFFTQSHSFCGNATFIPMPGGSAYHWYYGITPIAPPVGNNDTLYIPSGTAGDIYTLSYTNASGCRDSIQYTLALIPGGNSFLTNKVNVCPGAGNGSVVLNVNTTNPSPYVYTVINNANTVITSTSTAASSLPLTGLAQGSYTATINDGVCIYVNTFTIDPIQTNFSITTTNTVLCFPTDTAKLNLHFGAESPAMCGLSPVACSGGTPTDLFNAGPYFQNGTTSYPTPYGNYYKCSRTQFLVRRSELNAAGIFGGKISSLAFNILNLNASTLTYTNYSIKMGCTGLNDLPNVSGGVGQSFVTAGMQTVYTNSLQPVALGWLTHSFSQSYLWDGTSNILIEICSGTPTGAYSQNISVQLKQMSYVANMYHVEDGSVVCGGTQPPDNGFGTRMANGAYMLPNMKFNHCDYFPPASSFTVSVSANGTINHSYNNDSLKVVPTFTSPPLNNTPTVYTISVINPNGSCVATQTTSILYPALVNSVTAVPTLTTICIGNSVNLSASGTIYYNWYYMQGATQVSVSTSPTVNVTPPSAGTNTYIIKGSSPCPSSVPDIKSVVITVMPKADLLISPLQNVVKCMDKPYLITTGVGSATQGNAGTPYSYNWTTLPGNAAAPGNNTSANYTVTANTTTTLVLTVNGECANQSKDTVVISDFVNNLAVSILDTSTTCANTPFTLHANVTGGYPAYNFGWFIDGNSSSLSNTSSLAYTSPDTQGKYTIAVYVNDSCGYSKAAYEVITVLPPCTVVIPNIITPNGDNANEYFKIKNLEFHPNTSITIFDRWGRKVYENPNYNNEWKADGLVDGTFFYVIEVPDDKKYNGFVTVLKK